MKRAMMVMLLATTAALAGCNDKPQGTSPAPSGEAVSVKDDELVTPADFDTEAEKSITPTNYKSELDGLEKELNSEP
jgi:hypothetical protein